MGRVEVVVGEEDLERKGDEGGDHNFWWAGTAVRLGRRWRGIVIGFEEAARV